MEADALRVLLSRLQIPERGRVLVAQAWEKRQDRIKRPFFGCIGYMPSKKMGGTVAAPGRNLGVPLAILFEADAEVLAYYFEPFAVELPIYGKDNRIVTYKTDTPTALVIRRNRIVVQSWRTEGDLLAQSRTSPNFYKDGAFQWHWTPGEHFYGGLGFHHEVHSDVEMQLQHTLTMNLDDLSRYAKAEPLAETTREQLLKIVSSRITLTLGELQEASGYSADILRTAIAQGIFHCDLVHDRLDGTDSFRVYRYAADTLSIAPDVASQDRLPFQVAAPPIWATDSLIQFNGASYRIEATYGDRVKLHGKGDIRLDLPIAVVEEAARFHGIVSSDGKMKDGLIALYAPLTEAEEEEGIAKLHAIRNGTVIRSARQMRRLRAAVEGIETNAQKVAILAGRKRDRGNRSPRRPDLEVFAARWIRRVDSMAPRITIKGAYQGYLACCKKRCLPAFSYTTYRLRVLKLRDVRRKHGPRAAIAMTPIAETGSSGRPPNGWLPHQCVHIDHTPADVEVVGPTGTNLGRPLLTLAHDAACHRARALYVSFGAADSECVLMVLRDYARRWGCLPQTIVVDGGLNLTAKSVQRFTEMHNIRILRRAKMNPRQGAPIETTNRARESQVDVLLPGNTSHLKDDVRAYNGYPSPQSKAGETLYSLYMRYQEYFFQRKSAVDPHPALGMTPEAFEAELVGRHGKATFLPVQFDLHLLIQTSPCPKRPLHRVDNRRGVWVGYRWYWHRAFASAGAQEKALVRIERFSADVVYVEFRKTMVVAVAKDLNPFPGRTSYQMEQAIRQFREEGGRYAQRASLCSAPERDVLGLEARHFDPVIGLQEEELRRLYSVLGMLLRVDASTGSVACVDEATAKVWMQAAVDMAKQATVPPDTAERGGTPSPSTSTAQADVDAFEEPDLMGRGRSSLHDVDLESVPGLI